MTGAMTKGEREDLQRLIRQREKVFKSAAKQRSAELIADFNVQLAAQYAFDDDEVWAAATRAAQVEVDKAQAKVAARCRELGIPEQFAPGLHLRWTHRGYDSSVEKRRQELRRAAISQIEALEKKAIVQIETAAVEAQTQIAVAGLTSEAARAFITTLPSVESLMPALSFAALAGEDGQPLAQQLVNNNALRQRRYRERQRALRDAGNNAALPEVEPGDEKPATDDGRRP